MLKPNGHGFFHFYAIYLVIILFDMNSSSYATSCSILVSLNSLCIPITPCNRLSGTQIISTSHGMTGRNFFDVFLPFYLLFEF